MRKFVIAAGALLLSATVWADELPANAAFGKAPVASPPGWSGFYIGPLVGWTFGSSIGDYTGNPIVTTTPVVYYPFELKPDGANIGGLIGFNFLYGRWLYGIEGDLSWLVDANDLEFDSGGSGRYDEIEIFWTSHARGRIGYLLSDQFLIYFAGGWAFAETRNWHYALDALYNDTRTRIGYSLGGGIEAALNAHWLARVEYLYDHFDNEYFGWTSTRYSNSDLELNAIRIAIVFRPGG